MGLGLQQGCGGGRQDSPVNPLTPQTQATKEEIKRNLPFFRTFGKKSRYLVLRTFDKSA
jgi:hypothetical protein